MHLQDGPQLDLSAQVAKVKRKARPWKAIISLILAIAAAVASGWAHRYFHEFFDSESVQYQLIAAACAVAFCVFGSAATIGLAGKARSVLEPRTGPSHAAVVRYFLLLIGGFTTLVVTLVLFDVPVANLVLGGALTSVFVGIAAQQALGNVFAGLVLLLARPFRVGDAIQLRAGSLGGPLNGTVTEIGITYVRLDTGGSVMSVPNSQVLNAVVGPQPQQTQPQETQPQPVQPAPVGGPPGGAIDGTAAEKRVRSETLVAQGGGDQAPPGTPRPPGKPD
jgi:small-conductance mechanosensitive channel